jgi:hypothetical protein
MCTGALVLFLFFFSRSNSMIDLDQVVRVFSGVCSVLFYSFKCWTSPKLALFDQFALLRSAIGIRCVAGMRLA